MGSMPSHAGMLASLVRGAWGSGNIRAPQRERDLACGPATPSGRSVEESGLMRFSNIPLFGITSLVT